MTTMTHAFDPKPWLCALLAVALTAFSSWTFTASTYTSRLHGTVSVEEITESDPVRGIVHHTRAA